MVTSPGKDAKQDDLFARYHRTHANEISLLVQTNRNASLILASKSLPRRARRGDACRAERNGPRSRNEEASSDGINFHLSPRIQRPSVRGGTPWPFSLRPKLLHARTAPRRRPLLLFLLLRRRRRRRSSPETMYRAAGSHLLSLKVRPSYSPLPSPLHARLDPLGYERT